MKGNEIVATNSIEIDKEEYMKKQSFRILWMGAGFLCMGLGTVGVILPILPTVPFYMATVFCFAKSSRRLHQWFLGTPLYQRHLESFVERGSIEITGRDIRQINTENLRQMESYVTQETCLFHDSIANNIAVGKPGASRQEIERAAKKASIHDFIMSLPKGYETQVGELGDTLSGGERQRMGIARAFLHDAPLLLLDEPTSNLDALNEGVILKALREFCRKKTVVLVSHRRSTLNVADRILAIRAKK